MGSYTNMNFILKYEFKIFKEMLINILIFLESNCFRFNINTFAQPET